MKIWDRHFLRFAGAEPARQMRKEQRLAHDAYSQAVKYEKPFNDPERPSNKDRAFLEGVLNRLPDSDNPSKIAAAMSSFQTPIPEGQELTVVKDGPDNPSTIAAKAAVAAPAQPSEPPPDWDNPSAILKSLGAFVAPAEKAPPPPVMDLPADERPEGERAAQAAPAGPNIGDIPVESRPPAPEMPAPPPGKPTLPDVPVESRPAQQEMKAASPLALTAVDVPVSSRGDSGPPGSSLDLAAELRPTPQAPELTSGLIVSGTA